MHNQSNYELCIMNYALKKFQLYRHIERHSV